jgi:hypothetical protein
MSPNYLPLQETKEAAPVVHIKILYIKTQSLPSLQMHQYSSPLKTTAPTGSWGCPQLCSTKCGHFAGQATNIFNVPKQTGNRINGLGFKLLPYSESFKLSSG